MLLEVIIRRRQSLGTTDAQGCYCLLVGVNLARSKSVSEFDLEAGLPSTASYKMQRPKHVNCTLSDILRAMVYGMLDGESVPLGG